MRHPRRCPALAAALAVVAASVALAQPAPTFGTASEIRYHLGYSEFMPADSTISYFPYGPLKGLFATSPAATFVASPHIPTGARVTTVEFNYCDSNNSGQHIQMDLLDCALVGNDCHSLQSFQSGLGGCIVIFFDLTSQNYTMSNQLRELFVQYTLGSGDSTNVLVGASIGYKLQVSPGPGVATFADVPTTSPQFKFVEALYAAGITAGCGSGNFCPNQPLTRGQMAVFLSTALGLHFPN